MQHTERALQGDIGCICIWLTTTTVMS